MQIYGVNDYLYNKSGSNPNFGWGLAKYQIEKVSEMKWIDRKKIVRNLRKTYGIRAHIMASNTVAFCLDTVVQIMKNAGFQLPSKFSFEKLSVLTLGCYTERDVVNINMDRCFDYFDLERQNRYEDLGGFQGCSASKHFLNTYLHEFSHAAHYKNIIKNHGKKNGYDIYWNEFNGVSPNVMIKKPIIEYFDKLMPNNNIATDFFKKYKYSFIFKTTDLSEYFAELNVIKLAEKLGENCAISEINSDFTNEYKPFPQNYNIRKELLKNPQKAIIDIVHYFDGEIWNGNINNILLAHHSLRSM